MQDFPVVMVDLEIPEHWDPKVTLEPLELEHPAQKEIWVPQEMLVCLADLEDLVPQERTASQGRMVSLDQRVMLV